MSKHLSDDGELDELFASIESPTTQPEPNPQSQEGEEAAFIEEFYNSVRQQLADLEELELTHEETIPPVETEGEWRL